jgi:uncharacterized protein
VQPRKWNSKDLLLLLLYAPVKGRTNTGVAGRTRLQKLVFVFRKELYNDFRFSRVIPESAMPPFEAWKFGPFSKQVYSDIDFFRAIGFMDVGDTGEPPGAEEAEEYAYWQQEEPSEERVSESEYRGEFLALTPKGEQFVRERLWDLLDESQRDALSALKSKFNEAPLYSILQYVYTKYPDSAENSEIADRVLRGPRGGDR